MRNFEEVLFTIMQFFSGMNRILFEVTEILMKIMRNQHEMKVIQKVWLEKNSN